MTRSTFDEILNERAARARRTFEIPVLVAALAVVPVIYVETTANEPWLLGFAAAANWLIWGAFFVEYVTVVSLADKRWAYTRKAWLDVLIIVISFPLLPELLASTRLLRLSRLARVLRLLRLVALAAILTRAGRTVGVLFRRRGLGYVALLTLLVALGVGGAFSVMEGLDIVDGFWWAIVTLTTVGYGDLFPVTLEGRIAASVLMLLGIGFVAFITGSIAAHFVEDDENDLSEEIERLHQRLDRIEASLGTRSTEEDPAPSSEPREAGRDPQ